MLLHWQAVQQADAEAQRTTSVALRWQQLVALFRLARDLGFSLPEDDSPEVEAVRHRWATLKKMI